jgi:hypothetical protein
MWKGFKAKSIKKEETKLNLEKNSLNKNIYALHSVFIEK